MPKGIIIIIIVSLFLFSCAHWPGFEGKVFDKKTGLPVSDAYIIIFTSIYPFNQAFNVGGGNSHPDDFQVIKTKSDGYFKIESRSTKDGFADYRDVHIYKSGYYDTRILQLGGNFYSDVASDKLPISTHKVNTIYLKREDTEPNDIVNAAGFTEGFANYFKENDNAKYQQLRPFFIELYELFLRDEEQIKTTLKRSYIVDNWEMTMRDLRMALYDRP